MGCRVAKFCVTGTQSGLSEICLSLPLKVIVARGLTALAKLYGWGSVMAKGACGGMVRLMWMSRAMAGFVGVGCDCCR